MAGFWGAAGVALGGDTVCLCFGGNQAQYPLDENGELQITGLPRSGELLLRVLDPQGQAMGSMTLSFTEGAVIDASTSADGTAHIALRKDTDPIALAFSLFSNAASG